MLATSSQNWRPLVGLIGGIVLGAVLLVAAAAKVIEPGAFVEQIRSDGLDFLFSAQTVALIALGLETGIGVLLLTGSRSKPILVICGFLILFFLLLTGRNYYLVSMGLREEGEACGCFGTLWERTAAEAFWIDLLLLVPPWLLAWLGRSGMIRTGVERLRWTLGLASALVVVGMTYNSRDLFYIQAADQIAGSNQASQVFALSAQFDVWIDGIHSEEAQLYHSEGTLEFLLVAPELTYPVLLDPRSTGVTQLDFQVVPGKETIELAADGTRKEIGSFQISSSGLDFQAEGKAFQLVATR